MALESDPAGGYFAILPYLQQLQDQVTQVNGPSAAEIIRTLEHKAASVGINPIAANCQGKTPDEYLLAFPEILQLEEKLASKITPANVSEVFQLIRETEYYKPTQQVIGALQRVYLTQLIRLKLIKEKRLHLLERE